MDAISEMRGPRLLASIHDVSPKFVPEVERLLAALEPHVGRRLAMLVVPNHWGDAPIAGDRAFQRRLRAWADEGIEIFAHGWYHRCDTPPETARDRWRGKHMTAGEGEFVGLDRAVANGRIQAALSLIGDIIGRAPTGFIAPAWLYSPGAKAALADAGVAVAEDHLRVWSPVTGERLAWGPVVTWASRSPRRLASSLAFARISRTLLRAQRNLRIAVHPGDAHVPAILESVDATFSAASFRTPARYAALLESGG